MFYRRSCFTYVSLPLFPLSHVPITVSSLALGSFLTICENVARAAALCDLLAGRCLGFRIVLLLIPGSQISVWHCCGLSVFVVCFASAIPIPW